MPSMPYVIGLTGCMGSGKTSVVQHLQRMGATTINADAVCHESYKPGKPAHQKIIQEFGQGIFKCESFTTCSHNAKYET